MLGMMNPKERADAVVVKVSGQSRDYDDQSDGLAQEMKRLAFSEFVDAVKSNDVNRAMDAFSVYQQLCKEMED